MSHDSDDIEVTEEGLSMGRVLEAVSVMRIDDLREVAPFIGAMTDREVSTFPGESATKYQLRDFITDCAQEFRDAKNLTSLHVAGFMLENIVRKRLTEAQGENLARIEENSGRVE
jgi:hypothetical protein